MAIINGCYKCGSRKLVMRQLNQFTKPLMEATRVGIFCKDCGGFLTLATKTQRYAYAKICKIDQNLHEIRRHRHLLELAKNNGNTKDLWEIRYIAKQEQLTDLIRQQTDEIKNKVLIPMKDVWRMLEAILLKLNENIDIKF